MTGDSWRVAYFGSLLIVAVLYVVGRYIGRTPRAISIPTPTEAPLSSVQRQMLDIAMAELSSLNWPQQTALCLIHREPGLSLERLREHVRSLGFADVDGAINPILDRSIVHVDARRCVEPSPHAFIASKVEKWVAGLRRL
jgi:hypothetical protein